jgi:hypothetical protein
MMAVRGEVCDAELGEKRWPSTATPLPSGRLGNTANLPIEPGQPSRWSAARVRRYGPAGQSGRGDLLGPCRRRQGEVNPPTCRRVSRFREPTKLGFDRFRNQLRDDMSENDARL